jgi:hypothetical protein
MYHALRIIEDDLHVSDQAKWCHELSVDQFVDILWKTGFIRASIQPTGDQCSDRQWSPVAMKSPILNLRNAEIFDIHPMFRSFLDMHNP